MAIRKSLVGLVVTILAQFIAALSHGDVFYTSSVIELAGELDHYRVADFNGDQRQDVIVSVRGNSVDKRNLKSRELLVFFQQADGKFLSIPSKRIDLKKDIVAYGIADLRATPGDELLFFSRTAFFGFSTESESYANNLQKLGDWSLIESIPDEDKVSYIGPFIDLNNDGNVDLLLPGIEGYGVFYSGSAEASQDSFSFAGKIAKPFHHPQQRRATGSIGFDLRRGLIFLLDNANTRQPLMPDDDNNKFDAGQSRLLRDKKPLLHWEHWLAGVSASDVNKDNLFDFVFVDDFQEDAFQSEGGKNQSVQRKRLNVILNAKQKTSFEKVDYSVAVSAAGVLMLSDWNNDGFPDLVAVDHQEAGEAVISLYENKQGKFATTTPSQVMKFNGYDVDVKILDIDNDGLPEMLVSYYSLSAVDAVRNGNMLRTTLVYGSGKAGEGQGVFHKRPVVKLEEKFSSETFRGLSQRQRLSDDIDGDGVNDAVSIDRDGALTIKKVSRSLELEEEPMWRFVPIHLVTWFQPLQLNQDDHADIVMSHQRALTVLVSQ